MKILTNANGKAYITTGVNGKVLLPPTATTIPLSVTDNIDIDLSQHQLYQGVLGDGTKRTDRAFPTGSSLPREYFHYDVEVKFRKSSYPTTADENFIGIPGNNYNIFRFGFTRQGYVFARGWNRTNLNSGTISLDEDHIAKLKYNNNTVSLYIDGQLQGSTSVSERGTAGALSIGIFYAADGRTMTSTFDGVLYYVKMTDPTDNDKVVVNWDKTIVDENNKPVVFVNGDSGTLVQTLGWAPYKPTGNYADGFNPVNVEVRKYGTTINGIFGDIDANGELQHPTEPTNFVFTGVKSLPAYLLYYKFYNCTNINSVSFPDLETLNSSSLSYAFYNNTGLTSLTFPKLETINASSMSNMCYNCSSLTTVNLSSLTELPANSTCMQSAFQGCTSLANINFTNLATIPSSSQLRSTFYGCTGLTNVYFPALTSINSTAFGSSSTYYTFRSCTQSGLTIHFPSAMQSTIEAMTGYSAKWGATNATIVFDL